MNSPEVFLAYHCPRLRSEHLRSPCVLNMAKFKELRAKFPQALLGPLEHCGACKGKDLVVKESPAAATVKEKDMSGVVAFKSVAEAEKVLGTGVLGKLTPGESIDRSVEGTSPVSSSITGPPQAKGQFCKNHPEIESKIDKNGHHMGLCRECLAARAAANSRKRGLKVAKKKMTPAVARDLGIAPAQPVRQISPAETKIDVHATAPTPDPQPMCLTHNLPIKFNAKGVSMGGCEECRREIAAMGGHKAKIQLSMHPLERVFAGHDVELEWLYSQAREQVRTPEGQLIYLCKQAMREASVVG